MSSRDDEIWAAVNAALDERRDPSEQTPEVAALMRALAIIGRTPEQGGSPAVPRRTSSAGRAVAAAAAAVLVIAGVSYWAATRNDPPSPRICPPLRSIDVVRSFPPDASPVVSWSVRVERRQAAVTTSDSLGSDGSRTSDASTSESSSDSARIVVHSFTRHP